MAEQDVTNIATELIEAFNVGDWQRFKAVLAPDVRYHETGTQRQLQGADAYVQLCQGWKQAFPDARGTIQRTVASGETAVQEITWEGTHSGPMEGPGGMIAASGKPIAVQASVWVMCQGDTCQEIHHHLDVLSLLQQIGAIPTPGQASREVGA
jgi:steroid delta-isomerase-like uncharacterized protein